MSTNPEADDIIRELGVAAHQNARQAREMAAAMATGHEAANEHVSLSLAGGRLASVEFTEAAVDLSPVKLRKSLLAAWREAEQAQVAGTAAAIEAVMGPGLAGLVRGLAGTTHDDDRPAAAEPTPTEEDLAAGEEAVDAYHRAGAEGAAMGPEHLDLTPEALFADDPAYLEKLRRREAPRDWQLEFNAAIDEAIERGSARAQSLRFAEATAESRLFRVTAGALGGLVDVTVLGEARGKDAATLAADFTEVYGRACAEAAADSDLSAADGFLPGPGDQMH